MVDESVLFLGSETYYFLLHYCLEKKKKESKTSNIAMQT